MPHNEKLSVWIKQEFIKKFLGDKPHPFVLAMQHPSRATLSGYVVEHQHFLRQWVRSCASIIARTDKVDVTMYEIDNIVTEFFGGKDHPSHYELLLRMGEALGLNREKVLSTPPLPKTKTALAAWGEIAEKNHWLETMSAMHGLELINNRNLRNEGAKIGYFDPAILRTDEIPDAAKAFLREGYEADVGHSEDALNMIERYAGELGIEESVRKTFLKSIGTFDGYLLSRLERAREYEST